LTVLLRVSVHDGRDKRLKHEILYVYTESSWSLDIDRSVHLAQRRSGEPILNEKLDKVGNLLQTENLEQAFG